MSVTLQREPLYPAGDNIQNPSSNAYKFYEKSYTVLCAQESIYIPDRAESAFSLVTTGGTSFIEVTASPPSQVEAGTATWVKWSLGDVVSASAILLAPASPVAIRANITSGTCILSVSV